jgi:cbb3-type cytochrome oxidase maturation protein
MSILYFLVPLAILLAAAGVWGFLWAVRSGQFDDVQTPAIRILLDDEPREPSALPPSDVGPETTAEPRTYGSRAAG